MATVSATRLGVTCLLVPGSNCAPAMPRPASQQISKRAGRTNRGREIDGDMAGRDETVRRRNGFKYDPMPPRTRGGCGWRDRLFFGSHRRIQRPLVRAEGRGRQAGAVDEIAL